MNYEFSETPYTCDAHLLRCVLSVNKCESQLMVPQRRNTFEMLLRAKGQRVTGKYCLGLFALTAWETVGDTNLFPKKIRIIFIFMNYGTALGTIVTGDVDIQRIMSGLERKV